MIGPLAHPVGEGFDEGFKIGQRGQRRLRGETQLATMANALGALMRSVPSGIRINAEPSTGVGRLGPHGRDIDLPAGEGPIVRNAEHTGAGGVDALFSRLRRVVG